MHADIVQIVLDLCNSTTDKVNLMSITKHIYNEFTRIRKVLKKSIIRDRLLIHVTKLHKSTCNNVFPLTIGSYWEADRFLMNGNNGFSIRLFGYSFGMDGCAIGVCYFQYEGINDIKIETHPYSSIKFYRKNDV